MDHTPITPRTLVQETTERIECAILDGTIPLGSVIKEQQLARVLGVSRGPLREALRTLEGRKLVERVPNRPPRVVEMTAKGMADLLVMREALEGIAARLCAQHVTDADVEELARLVAAQDDRDEDHPFDKDMAFHGKILEVAGNPRIAWLLNDELYYLLKVYRLKSKNVPGRAAAAISEHRAVIEALAERDPDLAEALMRRHIRNSRANVLAALQSDSHLE